MCGVYHGGFERPPWSIDIFSCFLLKTNISYARNVTSYSFHLIIVKDQLLHNYIQIIYLAVSFTACVSSILTHAMSHPGKLKRRRFS